MLSLLLGGKKCSYAVLTILQAKAMGKVLFEQVCKQLHLLEADYFGLEYADLAGTKVGVLCFRVHTFRTRCTSPSNTIFLVFIFIITFKYPRKFLSVCFHCDPIAHNILLPNFPSVLAGPAEADLPPAGPLACRPAAVLLRQVLHAGPGPAGGGVHQVPVLPAGEARPGAGPDAVQRQHCRSDGQLHSSGGVRGLRGRGLSRSHLPVELQVCAAPGSGDGEADHGEPQEACVSVFVGVSAVAVGYLRMTV